MKPFPIDRAVPTLGNNNLDEIDGQTEIFVDDNYQTWVDNVPDTKPDLTFPAPTVNANINQRNYDTRVNNFQILDQTFSYLTTLKV